MLKSKIESLLFASQKPLEAKQIYNFLNKNKIETTKKEVEEVLESLFEKYNQSNDSGIKIFNSGGKYQLVSNPENGAIVKTFLKEDLSGELTQPQLETLTVVAYRGPLSKPILEQIRGVNCSLILRNLLIRGLVEEIKSEISSEVLYQVTIDFLRVLGYSSVKDLPEYEKLNQVENLEEYLNNRSELVEEDKK